MDKKYVPKGQTNLGDGLSIPTPQFITPQFPGEATNRVVTDKAKRVRIRSKSTKRDEERKGEMSSRNEERNGDTGRSRRRRNRS